MRRYSGEMLIGIGVLHSLTGLIAFGPTFAAMVQDGLFDSVAADLERQLAVWFTLAGPMLILVGLFARWALRRTGSLPRAFGIGLALIALLGLLFLPRSGFWAVLAVGLLAATAPEGVAEAG